MPDLDEFAGLLEQSKNYALDYIGGVDTRDVFPGDAAIRGLACLVEDLPDAGVDGLEILRLLHEYGSPATVATTGRRYFGFVTGGALPVSVAARWLADVWDQNAGLYVMSPIAATLEDVCEKWLVELLGLPGGTAMGLVSGSSMGTLCGLAAGRNRLLRAHGWDARRDGLFGAPPIRVVVGEEAHSTVFKALSLLGLGSARVEVVPSDGQGRMDATRVPELDDATLLILQAGNVNTGAFDPFERLCPLAREQGAWVHIDGAFGLWAAASRRFADLTASMALADSWSADAHKTLNVPYDSGIVFCRERPALTEALQLQGAYIAYSDQRDGMLYTPEMSRRARSVELWAALKALGRAGVAELVDDLHDKACYFADRLRENGFDIPGEACFNQVNVYVGDEAETRRVSQGIQSLGTCWCGTSARNGKPFIRISISSFRTTYDDIDRSVQAFARAASGHE